MISLLFKVYGLQAFCNGEFIVIIIIIFISFI